MTAIQFFNLTELIEDILAWNQGTSTITGRDNNVREGLRHLMKIWEAHAWEFRNPN